MNHDLKTILAELVCRESITPSDAHCQEYLIDFLEKRRFTCQRFDNPPVANFFARLGDKAPLLVFAGHTDVVPVGALSQWASPPFSLTEKNGYFYGRGVADMKGSLAAMMTMADRFARDYPDFPGSLGFLITSGEEGDLFEQGTPHVMSQLFKQGIQIDYCVVGEPSSTKSLGDVIKIGRRGSLTGKLLVQGKQGHVAYPHLADNPIHRISPLLAELTQMVWDKGNAYFPPTSFQITHIQAGGEANNIIPQEATIHFNFRFSTEQTAEQLQKKVEAFCQKHALVYTLDWRLNGQPFLTTQGKLIQHITDIIMRLTNHPPELSTSGGTSDGRFIAPYGVELIELGPLNASIHQVNEQVACDSLFLLSEMYYQLCQRLLT